MEPSSPTSSDCNHIESYELSAMVPTQPAHTVQPAQVTGRTRVRINSTAAEIPASPPAEPRRYSHVSEADSHDAVDQHANDAEELLRAHSAGLVNADYFSGAPRAEAGANESYAVTGNTQGGIFYQLLQAYKTPLSSALVETPPRPGSSGAATPSRRKWYDVEKTSAVQSQETLATLVGAATQLANPTDKDKPHHHKRTSSSGILYKVLKAKEEKDTRIKIHVANILKRQQYIIRMCRALMLFGAPTHRLEEYLAMTAKVLEINSQFLYIPGCMIISFDDVSRCTMAYRTPTDDAGPHPHGRSQNCAHRPGRQPGQAQGHARDLQGGAARRHRPGRGACPAGRGHQRKRSPSRLALCHHVRLGQCRRVCLLQGPLH
jgi:hypothetical protein